MNRQLPSLHVGVLGGGTVGRATVRAWIEHVKEVRVYDTDERRRSHTLGQTVMESDLVFVCVPETEIADLFNEIGPVKAPIFAVKSTVPVGGTQALADFGLTVFHVPEFLTARCATIDALCPAQTVIGYPNQCATDPGMSALSALSRVFASRFPGVPINMMRAEESELMKLAMNSFFAVKVAFFNEVFALADKLNLSWGRVMKGLLADGRISPSHTRVPGPDGYFGFGGKCLPKDLEALARCLRDHGCSPTMMEAAQARNRTDRRKEDA